MKTKLLTIILVSLLYFFNGCDSSMKDPRDGKTYETVKIGEQVWMAENLNYETENSYCYEDDPANCEKYGRLYEWDAALNACPSGWHLPTSEEFRTLISNVGGEETAGKMLKSMIGWGENGNGVDAFGFNVLPAGGRDICGHFVNAGKSAYFWSATGIDGIDAYSLDLDYSSEDANLDSSLMDDAGSVRCLRD